MTVIGQPRVMPRWLNLGAHIDAETIDEILTQANLNWTVSKRPLLTTRTIQPHKQGTNPLSLYKDGTVGTRDLKNKVAELIKTNPVEAEQFTKFSEEIDILLNLTMNEFVPLENDFAIVRDDIDYVFTTVGSLYTCLSNKECLEVLSNLITEHGIKVERAGVFNSGASVWVIAKVPEAIEIAGQQIDQYIRIGWAHDGTEKLTARFIYVNEKNLILSPKVNGAHEEVAIRHTKSAPDRAFEAKNIISKQRLHAKKFAEAAEKMVASPCDKFRELMKALFPNSDKVEIDEHGYSKKIDNKDTKMVDSLEENFNDTSKTYWDAFLVVTDYADNQRTTRVHGKDEYTTAADVERKKREYQLRNTLKSDGSSMKLKQKAWDTLTKPVLA